MHTCSQSLTIDITLPIPLVHFLQDVDKIKSKNWAEENQNFMQFVKKLNLTITEIPKEEEIKLLFHRVYHNSFQRHGKSGRKKWNKYETHLLIWTVFYFSKLNDKKFPEFSKENWKKIASLLNRDQIQCVFKFYSLIISQIETHGWSSQEKEILFQIVSSKQRKNLKFKWVEIAQEFYQKSNTSIFRNSKVCRGQWLNHLNPTIKKLDWTIQEDMILIKGYQIFQSSWTRISEELTGRNPDSIKNRFHHLCNIFNIEKNSESLLEDLKEILKLYSKQKMQKKENLKKNKEYQNSKLESKETHSIVFIDHNKTITKGFDNNCNRVDQITPENSQIFQHNEAIFLMNNAQMQREQENYFLNNYRNNNEMYLKNFPFRGIDSHEQTALMINPYQRSYLLFEMNLNKNNRITEEFNKFYNF